MKKRILSMILVCATLLTAIPMVVLPVAATDDTFAPDLRFVLVSDIHVATGDTNPGENVGQMMDLLDAYLSDKGDGVLPSAIFALGDLTDWATDEEYAILKACLQAATSEYETQYGQALPIYAVMGNHEYNNGKFLTAARKGAAAATTACIRVPLEEGVVVDKTTDLSGYYEANTEAFQDAFLTNLDGVIANDSLNWYYEIGGAHFIGISISNNFNCLSAETLTWLDAKLAEIKKTTPNAPVFLFGHAPLKDTVYTNNWSHYLPRTAEIEGSSGIRNAYQIPTAASVTETDAAFRAIIEKYPNVIFSTGHTHASITGGETPFFYQAETNGAGTGFTAYSPGALTDANGGNGDFSIVEIDKADGKTTVRLYPQHVTNGAYKNADGSDLYYEVVYEGESIFCMDVEIDSNYTSLYTHPTSGTGMNDYVVEGETLTFAPAWTIGAYSFDDAQAYLYDQNKGADNVFYSTKGSELTYGGMFINEDGDRRIILGTDTVSCVTYTAEKNGTLNFTIDNVALYNAAGVNTNVYAVVKNFSTVLTADNADFTKWTEGSSVWTSFDAETLTLTVENVEVQEGDTISFVVACGTGNGDGIKDVQMHVDYTKEVLTREYVDEAISYEHKVGGENYPVAGFDETGAAILATDTAYGVGTYYQGLKPYDTDNGSCLYPSQLGSRSAKMGYLNHDGSILLPTNKLVSYVAYTAEYDGSLDLIVNDLTFLREGTVFTVVKNFKEALIGEESNRTFDVYERTTSRGYWQFSEFDTVYSFAVCDIQVKKGDTVAIVFGKGVSMNSDKNVDHTTKNIGPVAMNIDVRYTQRDAGILTSKVSENLSPIAASTEPIADWTDSTWTPIVYEDRSTAGNMTDALTMDLYNGDEFSYTPFETTELAKAHAYISTGAEGAPSPLGAIMVSCNSAAGFRYVAEKTGNVSLSFEQAGAKSSNATSTDLVMGYAIFVNGVKVWPYGDNNWYNMRQEAGRTATYYSEQLNAALPKSLFVTEGDYVEILCRNDNGVADASSACGNLFLPQVSYLDEVMVSATATLNDKFAVTLYNVGDLGEGSAILGGELATLVDNANGTYTLAGIAAKEMGYNISLDYAYDSTSFDRGDVTVSVPHNGRFTWEGNYADLMVAYISTFVEDTTEKGQAIVNLAAAVLNYGAAAQTYFGIAGELVNAALTEEQKAISYEGEYEDLEVTNTLENATVTPYGFTLLLEDSVSIKLLVKGEADLTGYKVRFTANGKDTEVALEICDDASGYKAILSGLTPAQWNDTYEITVLDQDGNAVSNTIAYGVTTYAVRMAEKTEIKEVADKMLALYEKAIAFVNAWA